MNEVDLTEDFLCESCGFTSPVSNDTCPQCGGAMQGSDTKKHRPVDDEDGEDGGEDVTDAPEDESLEELREKEAGAESSVDSYDDNDNDL